MAEVQLPVSDGQLSSCHGHSLEAAGADLVHCGAGGGLGQASTQGGLHNTADILINGTRLL